MFLILDKVSNKGLQKILYEVLLSMSLKYFRKQT